MILMKILFLYTKMFNFLFFATRASKRRMLFFSKVIIIKLMALEMIRGAFELKFKDFIPSLSDQKDRNIYFEIAILFCIV